MDAQAPRRVGAPGRQHERGLREGELTGDALHVPGVEPVRAGEHGELVAAEWTLREHVQQVMLQLHPCLG